SKDGHDITILDRSQQALNKASETLDVMCIRGNGANVKTLIEANVEAADVIIAVTGNDELNMVCCLAAKQLGADAQVLSRSGIHYCHSKNDVDSFYDHYTKVASLPGKNFNTSEWDFANNPSDVVVINLGTNDAGKNRPAAEYTADAVSFIQMVREKNPNAIIIWTYGMMGNGLQSALEAAVKQVADAGDNKVFYLPLANYVTSTEGVAVGHPTVQTDINRSLVLAKFIAEKTGWEMDNRAMLQAQLQWSAQYNNDEFLADYTALSAKAFKDAYAAGEALAAQADAKNADLVAAAEAVWMAKVDLVSTADMAKDYIVIDRCDNMTGAQFVPAAGELDTEDFHEGVGALANSGNSDLVCINHSNYNVTLPEDWQNWYIEAWLYVSDPTAIPGGSCLEVSQTVDQIEVAWALDALGLQAGWNKLQLKMNSANGKDKIDQFTTIKNIRLFVVGVKKDLTIKIDNIVLSKGKAAADIAAWEAALKKAEEQLAKEEDAALRTAYEVAKKATSQADVDAYAARLEAAVEAAQNKPTASIQVGKELDKVTTFGRTYVKGNGILFFYWTNSGMSFRFNGTGATATLTASNTAENMRGYLNVYVDGAFAPSQTICLDKTTGTYTLAEGLPAGEHTIELRKRNEAIYGGSATIGIKELSIVGGQLLPPPEAPARQIEFIGDSITSGFGNLVTDGSGDYKSPTVEGTMTYAVLAAKQLGANAQVLSRSGIHYCHSPKADGSKVDSFYDHYTKTASLPGNVLEGGEWDFAQNPSDVVVINLGTNDVGAGRTNAQYTSDAVDFIKLVRSKNPNAVIIWTYGLMGNSIQPALEAAVKQVNDEGDSKVFYLPLANYISTTEGQGTHGHPSVQTNINRSIVLANFIAEKTGWEVDATPMLQAQMQWSSQYNNQEFLKDYTDATAASFAAALEAGEAMVGAASATNEEKVAAAEAIWQSYLGLISLADVSKEYIVVSPMDTLAGWNIAGEKKLDTTDFREGLGAVSTTWVGGNIININSSATLGVDMPESFANWYLEAWIYVDHPENIPSGSCLEISQVVDSIEIQWGLDGLGLQAGWNKIQLPLTSGGTNVDRFKKLNHIRCFVVNMTDGPLTLKIDNIVLAKGKAAADTDAWFAAVTEAKAMLAEKENADLRAAFDLALTAVTQSDVDAFTARLVAAIEAAGTALGDVDGDGAIISTDARLTLQFYAGKISEDNLDTSVADVDGDGEITSTDARLILQKYAGKIEKFPAE
ncbi:MAG: NAD-binding protein, partial [Clostridia bacterium]|nr:NAD-binding protein [Clostridia bacterium]